MQRLDVGVNQFSGSFDEFLGLCNYIVSFVAERNRLSGSLPANMASLGLMVCTQASPRVSKPSMYTMSLSFGIYNWALCIPCMSRLYDA